LCIGILLQPRKFVYKTKQKNRTVYSYKCTFNNLTYGDCGLKTLQPLRMSAKQIFRLKVFLKKAVRKPDLTKRLVWFNTFPHLPLTKKPKGMRMGKGSGKLNAWQIQMRGGIFVFEFKNLRPGRAIHFFKTIATKLPTTTKIFFNTQNRIKLGGASSTNPLLQTFW